jgi:hypothetical protein
MDGEYHVGKGKRCNYLKILYSRWEVEEGNFSDVLGNCLPNWDFPLGEGEIRDKLFSRVLTESLR